MGIAEIKQALSVRTYLEYIGVQLNGDSCPCPIHKGKNNNFCVHDDYTWSCFSKKCGTGADVIDLHMLIEDITLTQAIKDLESKFGIDGGDYKPIVKKEHFKIVKKYTHMDYVDNEWREIVSSFRQVGDKGGKKFFQQCPNKEDKVNQLKNIPFYHYERWCNEAYVFFCEGHKDVESLEWLGFNATCNLAGAGKLKNHNIRQFQGKRVYIFYDTDMEVMAGYEHAVTVLVALTGIAESVKIIHLDNQGYKEDVSDYLKRHWDTGLNKQQLYDKIKYVVKNQEIIIDELMRGLIESERV